MQAQISNDIRFVRDGEEYFGTVIDVQYDNLQGEQVLAVASEGQVVEVWESAVIEVL